MAMVNNKTLKIPRDILAQMTNNNPQAIKALEGLQLSAFSLLPDSIQDILNTAASDAQQAAMIANQLRQEVMPYLSAVSVPIEQSSYLQSVSTPTSDGLYLQSVGGSCDCTQQLQAI